MNRSLHNVAVAARFVTAAALLHVTLPSLRADAFLPRAVASCELAGIILLLVPRIWPAGGVLLLAVFALAAAHHAEEGASVVRFVFPAIVIVLLLAIERAEKGLP